MLQLLVMRTWRPKGLRVELPQIAKVFNCLSLGFWVLGNPVLNPGYPVSGETLAQHGPSATVLSLSQSANKNLVGGCRN